MQLLEYSLPFPLIYSLDHRALSYHLLLTFVRDLTFDLTFCLLFSFFLLKAFFPLKGNSDSFSMYCRLN